MVSGIEQRKYEGGITMKIIEKLRRWCGVTDGKADTSLLTNDKGEIHVWLSGTAIVVILIIILGVLGNCTDCICDTCLCGLCN